MNQVESHPYLQQQALVRFCERNGIAVTAFSPLGSSSYIELNMDNGHGIGVLKEPKVTSIAKKYGKTAAQVVLRWNVQRGCTIVPKSTNAGRLAENIGLFDFELDDADMQTMASLDRGLRYNDPGEFAKGFGREWAENGYPIYG